MIIGVTGIIGSGKSTVAALLAEQFKAQVIEADKIGHQVLEQSRFVRFWIKLLFGSLERREIAQQAFTSKTKLFFLNVLVHPFMRQRIKQQLGSAGDNFILDAALLFPMRLSKYCNHIVFVTAHKALIYKRLTAKGYTVKQIEQRLTANQGVYKYKKRTIPLSNNGTLARLKETVSNMQF